MQTVIAVPNAGACTWKLLSTPDGLTADFLANLGSNYPNIYNSTIIDGATCIFDAAPLGNEVPCSALTVDADSLYMGANTSENVASCIKLSKSTPNTRLWSCANFAGVDRRCQPRT